MKIQVLTSVLADRVCAAIVDRMPTLGLAEWWLTGGAVFQNVWNALEDRPPGWGIKDYDVFYFDDTDLSWRHEDRTIRAAAELFSDLDASIELRNQARVHLWYAAKFGVEAPPHASARSGIQSFAATTCSVGIRRGADGLEIYAPYGLDDLLAMRMVPNPRLAPRTVYETKVAEYRQRWPSLTAAPWPI
jgi:uncharacterized protein